MIQLGYIEQLVILLTKREMINDVSFIGDVSRLVEKFSDNDWNLFMKQCRRHHVLNAVYHNILILLSLEPLCIPYEMICAMEQTYNCYVRIADDNEKERVRLANIFYTKGVKVVFLKGSSYDRYLDYPKGYRMSKDIDILVNEQDLFKVNRILVDENYKSDLDPYTNQTKYLNQLTTRFNSIPYGVLDYKKNINDNDLIYLDMHKVADENIFNSKDMYNNSVMGMNTYYELDIYDLLIYSCYHAYHHYGIDSDIMKLYNLPILKLYMDIRELLIYIDKNELKLEFSDRVKKLQVQYIVNEMIKITEQIYQEKLCEIPDVTSRKQMMCHNGINPEYETSFITRLFGLEQEKEKIILYAENEKRRENERKGTSYKCHYLRNMNTVKDDEIEWQQYETYNTGIDSYWHGRYNLFGASLADNIGRSGEATFCWDEDFFYLKCKIIDPFVYFPEQEVFKVNQTQIGLYFGGEKESSLFVQPKQNGRHKIYLNNYTGLDDISEIDEYSVNIKEIKDGCIIYSKIRWNQLEYLPKMNSKINFGINILLYQEKLEYPLYISFYKLCKNKIMFTE